MIKKTTICIIALFLSASVFANKVVTVIAFNDFHGHVTEDGDYPGMVKFAGAVKARLKRNPNPILVSAGDNYQGSALSNLTFGAPVNALFRELHLSASAVGNHEFDWGEKRFKAWEKKGNFPFLAANIYSKKTHKPVSFSRPYLIVKRAGVKIAFIGLATQETPMTTMPDKVKNLRFIDDVKAAQYWINYLKAGKDKNGKPDAIIALTHIPSYQHHLHGKINGKEINNLCQHIHGLDAVISAHSHQLVNGEINHIPVIQAMKYGQALGILSLTFNDHHQLLKISHHITPIYKRVSHLPKDHHTQLIYQHYAKDFDALMNKPIGFIEHPLSRTKTSPSTPSPLGRFVCSVLAKESGADIAIVNRGSIRQNLKQGTITQADIFDVAPFNDKIYTVTLSGKKLRDIIKHSIASKGHDDIMAEFSGIKIQQKPKLTITLSNNTPLNLNKNYVVATSYYLLSGGDGYSFKGGKNIYATEKTPRDMLVNYIRQVNKVVT